MNSVLQMERAYFATGCFWGAERRFWQMPGVLETSVGYMGGSAESPTYEEVCKGRTGHAEVVEVVFDPSHVSYQQLLAEFWMMHDPTSLNSQGNDVGTQYRSAVFATSPAQLATCRVTRDMYQEVIRHAGYADIVTQIVPAAEFTYWPAENYHQKYLLKNPNGYDCHSGTNVAFPRADHVI